MKKIRFSIIAIAALLVLGSCTKHKLWFPMDEMPKDWAEFQLHYMEPVTNVAANYIDSVYVNGVLYASTKSGNALAVYNGVPGGGVGKFYGVKAGSVHFQCYRGGEIVYDRNVTLEPKKQNVIIHDLNADPIVIDNDYPYWDNRGTTATAETWGSDSVAKVMFVNLLYEAPGVPYPGKLQYQYRRNDAKADDPWNDIGEPVGFGEATKRTIVIIHYTGGPAANQNKTQRENYRILTEDGNVLQYINSNGKLVNYSDYWNASVGRVYMHFYRGIRTQKSPYAWVSQWVSL